jgi:ABC-type nitrate/sulfonate/bicarbonate transport system permease component
MRVLRAIGRVALRLWPFVLVIVLWQTWITMGHVERIVAPTPSEVLHDIWLQPAVYLKNTAWTLLYAMSGLALGMTVGSGLALLCWFSPLLRGLLTPGTILLQSVPVVAIVPIMALIFGYAPQTVVGVAALLTFFPTFVFVSTGMRASPNGSDDLFSVLGASRGTRLRRLAAPAAIPNFLIALRLNASIAIIAAIIGEYLMGQSGLGHMFAQSFQMFDTPQAWGASLVIVALSVVAYGVSSSIERRTRPRWTV